HARTRRVPAFWLALVSIVLVTLPEVSINTASCWTGAVGFYALYRTVSLAETPRAFAVAAIVGAATCTLRMNYAPGAVLYLVLVAAARARQTGWRIELRSWRLAAAAGVAAIVPWCIVSSLSSLTVLYLVMAGTG